MESCTRTELVNLLAMNESAHVFIYVSDVSTYCQVVLSYFIRKVAECNVAYWEYEISNTGKYIFISAIK